MSQRLLRVGQLAAELKRRHVTRVAMVYCGVAWVVVQVADAWSSALMLPDWSVTLVVLLASLGFPVALVLAWALEITPTGVRRTHPLAFSHVTRPQPLAEDGDASVRDGDGRVRSIAVLPFVDLSPESDHEYLSDGLAEELLNELARVQGLRVVSRTSSFAFKGKPGNVRRIGAALQVGSVLEGSVRRVGDRVRIRVQLTNVEDGYLVWSDMYERTMEDLFALQDEIARSVLTALRERFPELALPATPRPSARPQATFEMYLKGRYHWNKRTQEGLEKAISCFEAAVAADPGNASAHAGLADSLLIMVDYGLRSPGSAVPRARVAAQQALALDGSLGEGYASLALVEQFEWNWIAAERLFRRAVATSASYATAHQRFALFLTWMGRSDEGQGEIESALRLESVSPVLRATAGLISYYARNYALAIEQLREALDLNPGFATTRIALGMTCVRTAQHAAAIDQYEAAIGLAGATPIMQALLSHAYGAAGRTQEAEAVLARLQDAPAGNYVPPYYLALAHLGLRRTEAAITCLEHAHQHRSNHLIYLKTDPMLDPLRDDSRFALLLTRLGLEG